MILPDVNLLLYAIDETSSGHGRAAPWLGGALSGTETVAFTWAVLLAFLRLVTNPRVFTEPLGVDEAIGVMRGWLTQPAATVVAPTPRHLDVMGELLAPVGAGGNLVADAHLAALAIEHGAELHSADRDFGRFPGLSWRNPLEE